MVLEPNEKESHTTECPPLTVPKKILPQIQNDEEKDKEQAQEENKEQEDTQEREEDRRRQKGKQVIVIQEG